MSNQTEMSKEAGVKAANAKKPEFMLTTTGVMILGGRLVGDKMTALACEAIKMLDADGVALIEFRTDNYPVDYDGPVFGMAYADTHSMVINLQHCWEQAIDSAVVDKEELSFLALLWINVLSAIGHEIDHLNIAYGDRELYEGMRSDPELNIELEKAADETARSMMIEMARTMDIEPDIEDLGWFSAKIMGLFTDDDTKALDWVSKLRNQLEQNIIYDGGEEKRCFTLREFIHMSHDPHDKVGDWGQATTPVNLTAHIDEGVVEEFKANPVEQPVVEAVVLESDEEVPAKIAAMGATADQSMFITPAVEGEPDVIVADHAGVVQNIDTAALDATKALQNEVIQALMDAPNPQPITPEVVAQVGVSNPIEAAAAGMVQAVATLETETVAVPLPPQVAEQVAITTAAATTATPAPQYAEPTYTPNTLAPEIQAAVMKDVWQLLYHHVFTKCGWQQNPQTGRFMFTSAAAVLEGVNIQSVITKYGADNFIMEYDTLNAEGQPAAEMCQGMIRGRTTSKQGLPSYALYLNINGQRIKRSFIPQNPEKMTNNAYTKSAEEAAGGHMIVWVFKDEVADGAPFSEKCAVTIKDNVYEIMS